MNKKIILSASLLASLLFVGNSARAAPPVDWGINGWNYLNKAGGVPQLDDSGSITNAIKSPNLTVSSTDSSTYPVLYVGQDMSTVFGSPLFGHDRVQIGGSQLKNAPGSPLGYWAGLPQRLLVGGNTDGPYNDGCALCIFTKPSFQNTQLAELGGDNFLQNYKVPIGFDMAGIYWEAGEIPARLVLEVSSYTASSAVLTRKLTADELLLIHQGQYIVTNSLADGATVETSLSDKTQFMAGIVKGVDNSGSTTVINVYAWNTQGSSGSTPTPSLTNFDTFYFPNLTKPTVLVGAGTKMFGFNTMMQYNGSETGAGTNSPVSAIHNLEWGEVDVNVQNETRPHMLSYHGLTFGGAQSVPSGATIAPHDVFTSESYEMMLANDIPHHLIITEACGNMAIETTGFYLPGKCNLYTATPDASSRQARELVEFSGYTQNTSTGAVYNYRVPMFLESDDGDYDYTHADFHISPRINGTVGGVIDDGGSTLGDLDFTGTGGFKLCSFKDSTKCGLILDGSGNATMKGVAMDALSVTNQISTAQLALNGNLYFQTSDKTNQIALYPGTKSITVNGIASATDGNVIFNTNVFFNSELTTSSLTYKTVTYTSLPTSQTGTISLYCSDCYSKLREDGDTSTGIMVYWNGSSWRDALGLVVLH